LEDKVKKWTVLLLTIAFTGIIFWSCSDDGGGTTDPVNKAPTCVITSPAPDSIIDEGSLINVTVNADDTDGEISKVYYSINDNLVDSAVASPYSKNISTQGLLLGQYYIIVTAKDTDNKYSDPDSVFFSISPKAPSNISIIQESITTAGISWNDNSYGEDKFVLERKTASETEYNVIVEITGSDTSTKSYADESLVPGTTYNYRIKSVKETFESNYILKDYDNIFSPPSDLSIKQSNVYTFRLNWKSNSVGEDGFKIERSIDESDYTEIASVTDTIYVDDAVSKGYTTVNYRVRAYKGDIYTDYVSDNSSVSFPEPTNLVYTKETLSTIRLNWADNSYGEEGFKIDKKVGTQDWISSFASVGENITTWTDTNAEINEYLQYRIYGYKGLNLTESVSTEIIDNTIPAPTALSIVQNNVHTFTLYWTDNSLGEDGFRIERKIDEGEFTEIATVTETNYVDDSVAKKGYGTVYYQIRAYKGIYNSAYATANSEVSFPAPTYITATQLSLTSVNLTWDDNSIGEEIFEIERKLSTESTYIKIGEVVGNDNSTQSWIDDDLEPTKSYIYQIKATYGLNSSIGTTLSYDNIVYAPSDLTYKIISSNQLELNWTDNSNIEEGYIISRKIGLTSTWTEIATVDADSTKWTDDGYDSSESNHYKVRAHYTTYFSDYSNEIVAGMVYVTGGTFQMGDHFNEGYSYELPLHNVTVGDFRIGATEVTQSEWTQYMPTENWGSDGMGDNYPAFYVSWYKAIKYCNLRSMSEGLTPCYTILSSTDPADWGTDPIYGNPYWDAAVCDWNANGYRLPSEAEWEYAARGGIHNADNYHFSGSDTIDDVAWYEENSGNLSHPVGEKFPNQLGLFDMTGNVWEWCWDWYDSGYYTTCDNLGTVIKPVGPDTGTTRVFRGGHWYDDANNCRIARREYGGPFTIRPGKGIRLARTR
jgi:formylglycine-generating enzyme required for sulfatase activity